MIVMLSDLQVLSGEDIHIVSIEDGFNIKIKHPKLIDIKEVKEENYGTFIETFCSKPFDLLANLHKVNIDYETIGEYELFNMIFPSNYYSEDDSFRQVFDMFFELEGDLLIPSTDKDEVTEYIDILEDGSSKIIMNKESFSSIQQAIKMLTGFTNKKPEKFANAKTKEAYIEDVLESLEIAETERSSNSMITMADLIGAVILDTSYTYENVWDMYIYQFHSCTRMILKREDYNNTMTGIYTGNLDPKKVNLDKLYWLNKN